jgi:hypothetical protein
MKTTFEIALETAKVFSRFASEMPHSYMQEIFGKDDAVLAEKCLQAPKYGASALFILLCSLSSDERKALVSHINRKTE